MPATTAAVRATTKRPPADAPWRTLHLGTIQDANEPLPLEITEDFLKTHLAVFGGTRYGKSKLFELICRELIDLGRGFAFIDPHSDTADDLLTFLAARYEGLGFLRRNIHYLNPGERLFSFDPFVYRPDARDADANADVRYRSWLHTKIKDMVNIIVRQQGDTEDEKQKMVRLKRWLYNVLYAVGVRQDDAGTHLPLRAAFALLNPAHPDHDVLYEQVESYLRDEVRSDFEKLRATRDPRKQEDWVESTFNRLRDILSPIVERIFNLEAPSIDFRDIIRRNGVILASLGKTPYFHEDEALAIAGLLIREISEASRTAKRDKRKQFYLFIDEAHHFLGDDLLRIFKESAKYKLSLGLAVQGLDNLQKGAMDLVPAVLGQCGIRITFRQQYAEHAEILAKCLCYPMLDFTELLHEVDRNDGYDWVITPSVTHGEGETKSIQIGRTTSRTRGVTHGRSVAHSATQSQSRGENRSLGLSRSSQWHLGVSDGITRGMTTGESFQHSRSATHGRSASSGKNTSTTASSSHTESLGMSLGEARGKSSRIGSPHITHSISESNGRSLSSGMTSGISRSESTSEGFSESQTHGTVDTFGQNRSRSLSESSGRQSGIGGGKTISSTQGQSITEGRSRGTTRATSTTRSETIGQSESVSRGTSTSKNRSVTLQLTPLHQTRVEQQKTGHLEQSVMDQFVRFAANISSLSKQHCLVAIAAYNRAFVLRVDNVVDPFEERFVSPAWRRRVIERLKRDIFSKHGYYFSADENPPLYDSDVSARPLPCRPASNGAETGKLSAAEKPTRTESPFLS